MDKYNEKKKLEQEKNKEAIKDTTKTTSKTCTAGAGGPLVRKVIHKVADSKAGQKL